MENVELSGLGRVSTQGGYAVFFSQHGDAGTSSAVPGTPAAVAVAAAGNGGSWLRGCVLRSNVARGVVAAGTSGLRLERNVAYETYGQ
jgi:hypothetical protein